MTRVLRIAAFSDGNKGGNPAGVWIGDALPDASKMQAITADVGFSETAFAAPEGDAGSITTNDDALATELRWRTGTVTGPFN